MAAGSLHYRVAAGNMSGRGGREEKCPMKINTAARAVIPTAYHSFQLQCSPESEAGADVFSHSSIALVASLSRQLSQIPPFLLCS